MATVVLDWNEQRSLVVHYQGQSVHVVAHPELSESQVAAACRQLGEAGPSVLHAWREAVGLSSAS